LQIYIVKSKQKTRRREIWVSPRSKRL